MTLTPLTSDLRRIKTQIVIAILLACTALEASSGVSIKIEDGLLETPFSGKIYVVISPQTKDTMPLKTNYWFKPIEIISKDVYQWDGQSELIIDRNDIRYNKAATKLPTAYELQVLARVNRRDADPFTSIGNLYSDPILLDSDSHENLNLFVLVNKSIDQHSPLYPEKPAESSQLKLFSHHSSLLSKFHKQPYSVDVAVHLPKDWQHSTNKKWPVLYYISGMGGSELEVLRIIKRHQEYFDKFITVSVNAMNYGGHSVFADSANTGPWGTMLVEEIVPKIDGRFRGAGASKRYLTGISSGGWSSLWLQVKYPDEFASTWSFAPDSIDFRDFHRINLYAKDQNFYTDNLGYDRVLVRSLSGKPLIKSRDFIQMEQAIGEGGQIRSFEYVFSPRGKDGLPVPFFDRETGKIDRTVIEHWKSYDIRLYLNKHWENLKDKLNGKLNVYGGEKDQIFLENPVRLLKEELTYLDANANIEVLPEVGHAFDREKVVSMLKIITSEPDNKPIDQD
ncbi:alpha/beta hydrolase-fold protein [Simiduia aestuariiviva]|uniref:Esterase n=1 Tax=Simiduia aestuariiviva TaxID=1510459 RepID=A0A839ULC8_9GAMM|nr:alpha/beta hydrolase-fold protein [Simiduia aestuariiviva]MBB3167390.1 hypothetical protein [Simiduia aestuariiviva]